MFQIFEELSVMSKFKRNLSAALLLSAAAMTANAQLQSTPSTGTQVARAGVADVYGEPKTRAEVRADLELWKQAGLDEFSSGEATPDTFSREYKAAYAEYIRLRSGPEYQQEVERQSGM
ncbi:DUF4148 domain-containing protein [Pollutimonas sp. H1-120]|uniref:DUF4148 domain-containing protein n=1 Tax=Pollutimonas sp. H1-120 TaxID=3148824 RepID=UPI003B521F1F